MGLDGNSSELKVHLEQRQRLIPDPLYHLDARNGHYYSFTAIWPIKPCISINNHPFRGFRERLN